MRALAIILLMGIAGVVCAQVVLTPVNRSALLMNGHKSALNVSNAVQIISGLKPGMAQTNFDHYLNAHGMTNSGGFSLDRGEHTIFLYDFPGTDSTLVLATHSRQTGPNLSDWGYPVLVGGCIQRLGVDTYLITFTNAP